MEMQYDGMTHAPTHPVPTRHTLTHTHRVSALTSGASWRVCAHTVAEARINWMESWCRTQPVGLRLLSGPPQPKSRSALCIDLTNPKNSLPIAYTRQWARPPKFGLMPQFARGCYVETAATSQPCFATTPPPLELGPDGKYRRLCRVQRWRRISGLETLVRGAWDSYPGPLHGCRWRASAHRALIIDAGVMDPAGNSANIDIRGSPCYTGTMRDRVRIRNEAGALVNEAYYGEGNMIDEFMNAAVEVFGDNVLLQFEDFNSNDAFPLLASTRRRFLTYNDDIQGTAAVTVAGILGALKLKYPQETDLLTKVKNETICFFGSGSANLGAASLLCGKDGGMSKSHVFMTGSRGLIWKVRTILATFITRAEGVRCFT